METQRFICPMIVDIVGADSIRPYYIVSPKPFITILGANGNKIHAILGIIIPLQPIDFRVFHSIFSPTLQSLQRREQYSQYKAGENAGSGAQQHQNGRIIQHRR